MQATARPGLLLLLRTCIRRSSRHFWGRRPLRGGTILLASWAAAVGVSVASPAQAAEKHDFVPATPLGETRPRQRSRQEMRDVEGEQRPGREAVVVGRSRRSLHFYIQRARVTTERRLQASIGPPSHETTESPRLPSPAHEKQPSTTEQRSRSLNILNLDPLQRPAPAPAAAALAPNPCTSPARPPAPATSVS